MFVEQNELKSAWKLAKMKLGNKRKTIILLLMTALGLFLADIISSVIFAITRYGTDNKYTISNMRESVLDRSLFDPSIWLAVFVIAVIIISICQYRANNKKYEVYPQTNTVRFLSSQIIYFSWILLTAFTILIKYLIEYAVFFPFIKAGTIITAYKFDLSFLISGFFVMIIYLTTVGSFITFFTVIFRKFRYYTVICLIIITGMFFINIGLGQRIIADITGFLIFEKSISIFLVKGFLLSAGFMIASTVINKYTVYFKSQTALSKFMMTVSAITAVIVIAMAPILMIFMTGKVESTVTESTTDVKQMETGEYNSSGDNDISNNDNHSFTVDASGVPDGTKINIVYNDIGKDSNMQMYFSYDEYVFSDFKGNKIVVEYTYPINKVDNLDLTRMATPEVSARLDGNTLYIDYSYNNVKVLFIPVWSFMWQFDAYKGKTVFNDSGIGMVGMGHGNIYVYAE